MNRCGWGQGVKGVKSGKKATFQEDLSSFPSNGLLSFLFVISRRTVSRGKVISAVQQTQPSLSPHLC